MFTSGFPFEKPDGRFLFLSFFFPPHGRGEEGGVDLHTIALIMLQKQSIFWYTEIYECWHIFLNPLCQQSKTNHLAITNKPKRLLLKTKIWL